MEYVGRPAQEHRSELQDRIGFVKEIVVKDDEIDA